MRLRNNQVKARQASLKASPFLLAILWLATSCLISINCASLTYGDLPAPNNAPGFESRRAQLLGSFRSGVYGETNGDGRSIIKPALSVGSDDAYAFQQEFTHRQKQQQRPRYLLENEAEQPSVEYSPNGQNLIGADGPNYLVKSSSPNNKLDDQYEKLILASVIPNHRLLTNSRVPNDFLSSLPLYQADVTSIKSNDNIDSNEIGDDASDLSRIIARRLARANMMTTDGFVDINNNQLDNNQPILDLLTDQQSNDSNNNKRNNYLISNRQEFADDDADDRMSSESVSKPASQRPNPVVSTLVEDEAPKSDVKITEQDTGNSKKNKNYHAPITANENNLGRVIERAADRSDKSEQPSWQLFLSRIYETVFGSEAPSSDVQHNKQPEHTKPSVVSSDTQTNSNSSLNSTIVNATNKTRDAAASGETKISSNDINNPRKQHKERNQIVIEEENQQLRDKKTKKIVNLEVAPENGSPIKRVNKKASTNNKQDQQAASPAGKSALAEDESEGEAGESLPRTFKSSINDEQQDQQISMMRKSTFVLPMEDSDDEVEQFVAEQQQSLMQPTSPLHASNGLSYQAAQMDNNGVNWAPLPGVLTGYTINGQLSNNHNNMINNNNNNMETYKSFSRRYHPGQPIFGFTPQVLGTQGAGGIGYRPNRTNDLYFLVMVGAFCVMAVAMVLAAGLFAYRVQQNRKSSTEMDYPTYGVVGPNSVAGAKLGAVGPSFVGGYFAHNPQAFGIVKPASKAHASSDLTNQNGSNLKNNLCNSSDGGFNSPNDSGIAGIGSLSSGKTNSAKRSPSDNRPPSFMASQQNAARIYHYQHQKQQMISSERNSSGRHTSASDLDSDEENEDGNYTVYECPGLASAHDMEIKNPLFNDDRSP